MIRLMAATLAGDRQAEQAIDAQGDIPGGTAQWPCPPPDEFLVIQPGYRAWAESCRPG